MHLIDNLGLVFLTAIIVVILVSFNSLYRNGSNSYLNLVYHDIGLKQPLSTSSLPLPRPSNMGHISHALRLGPH